MKCYILCKCLYFKLYLDIIVIITMNLHNNSHSNWTVLRHLDTSVLWKVAWETELIYFHLHLPQYISNLATLHKLSSRVHQLYTHNAPVVLFVLPQSPVMFPQCIYVLPTMHQKTAAWAVASWHAILSGCDVPYSVM